MAVQFLCPHPKCGKLIQMPDSRAGQQVPCPMCRQPVTVPGGQDAGTATDQRTLDSYHQFLRGLKEHQAPPEPTMGVSAPPPPPAAPPQARRGAGIPEDGMNDLSRLPQTGVVLPARPDDRTPVGWAVKRGLLPLAGSFWQPCLAAVRHPGIDAGSVLAFALCLAVLETYLYSAVLLSAELHVPKALLLAGAGVLLVVAVGYGLSVCLALTGAAASGGGRLSWMRRSTAEVLRNGLLGLSVAVVYVLPVITLPLLPLAMLTLALTRNGRAFDLRWQVRSAFRYGEGFGILWLFLLGGGAVAAGAWWAIHALAGFQGDCVAAGMTGPEATATRIVIRFLAAFVAGVCVFVVACGLARCTGLLARFRPVVTATLPVTCRPAVTWGIVVGCLAVAGGLALALL